MSENLRDPLTSPSTSRVLFNLILGRRSPLEIAKHVGDTPPAIIKHLWRLRKEGIVSLAEKSGKFQYYSVNWDKLVWEAVHRMGDYITAEILAVYTDKEKANFLEQVWNRLLEDKYFKTLFKLFIEEEAKKLDREDVYLQTTRTFEDAVRKFEKYLPQVSQHIISDPKDKEKAEFIALIKVLSEAIKEAHEYESIPLKNTFRKLGLLNLEDPHS